MAEQGSNTKTEGAATSGVAAGSSTKASAPNGGTASSESNSSNAAGSTGDLRQKVASTVDSQKNRAADGLGNIADAARQTGEELRGQNEMLASWVNTASDQLRNLADHLRDRPATELADDLTRFARQRPALFIGGAFLLGLGMARLLKASPEQAYGRRDRSAGMRDRDDYYESGMGGTVSGTGEQRRGGTWVPDTGAY